MLYVDYLEDFHPMYPHYRNTGNQDYASWNWKIFFPDLNRKEQKILDWKAISISSFIRGIWIDKHWTCLGSFQQKS